MATALGFGRSKGVQSIANSTIETQYQYTKEWLADDRILCYRFMDLTPATLDHWAADLTEAFLNWPEVRPWRLMLDVRLGGGLVNAYALRHARKIAHMRPELPGRLAILVGSKLASDIISMAIRTTNNIYRQRRIFSNEAAAVNWLIEPSNLPGTNNVSLQK